MKFQEVFPPCLLPQRLVVLTSPWEGSCGGWWQGQRQSEDVGVRPGGSPQLEPREAFLGENQAGPWL